jgi:glucose/arabinose dehydrogenase
MMSARKSLLVVMLLSACGRPARLPVTAGFGPTPSLPEPEKALIPLVNVVTARGWPEGEAPTPAPGTTVTAFATGLDHPRWIYVLPNGDVLVAETNAPPRPEDAKGIKGFFFNYFQKKAGGAVPSANRIALLRDADGDGISDMRAVFISNLVSPFGMALVGNNFYVANTDAVVKFPYATGVTSITSRGTPVAKLPGGALNHHWTKSLIASGDGATLYVTVGSNSNVAENGLAAEEGRAAIWAIERATGRHRVFASGLRNPNGMAWGAGNVLWTVVNERDEIGSDLVPDYLTSVKEGGFYGWPYSYFGAHVDERVQPQLPELVSRAIVPDYALGAHTASLGLCSAEGSRLGAAFAGGMFVGQHGSWNRRPLSGYKVLFVPFRDGKPSGMPRDVLTGFLDGEGKARGRPVGVALDAQGALLVAEDVGKTVWRVSAAR